ncbi:MAG: ferrochelatase [Actinobacteria bacterium]|nr:ferrochelatase [Actinomycetota bacterium]
MAYGTASGPDDIERYYTDIRGGRPPSPELLLELTRRFAAIGNGFRLLDTTRAQAEGLERELNAERPGAFKTYLGMKHSPPFIPEGVAKMREHGIERAVGIVMAPHYSRLSVEAYVARVEAALADGGPEFSFVRQWHDHPLFIALLASRVSEALGRLAPAEREGAAVVFSAHSLPARILEWNDPYPDQLRETADLVAERLGLSTWTTGWQSAGRTPEPWLGPPVDEVIRELASKGHPAVVVCSAGFVADHLETLYDLDIEAQGVAREAGIRLVRTEMPNADPRFLEVLAAVVRDHLRRTR